MPSTRSTMRGPLGTHAVLGNAITPITSTAPRCIRIDGDKYYTLCTTARHHFLWKNFAIPSFADFDFFVLFLAVVDAEGRITRFGAPSSATAASSCAK